eukprot:TRINITY_DN5863_c0_g2_i1.p1 TRINITY_DN5863_c0_g2~~TRINITY_DN5863_c0_g2_i1.p1  ORF type:complete len:445 (-),score=65.85 TRINITY_DN5863_c0_g2_i1:744-2078(-)
MSDRAPCCGSLGGFVTRIIYRIKNASRWAFGVFLLLLVVLIWVGSGNLMQYIFVDSKFDHPFFLTYFSTSLFSLYLSGFIFCRSWRHQDESVDTEKPKWAPVMKNPVSDDSEVEDRPVALDDSQDSASEAVAPSAPDPDSERLPVTAIMKLSIQFCVVWFLANWTYNASLSLTSVTSNTIISTTSSFFTLVFTHFCGVEKFTIKRLIAVMVVFGGIVLVSISDNDEGTQTLWGDALALTGAVFYGAYCSLLRVKIRDEKQVNMPMFFGFVGFFNMVLLWPFLILLHYTGIEKFEVPSLQVTVMLTINGLIGTVVSDLIWSLSIFLTSALLGTLGLSLTVPLALTIDLVRGKKRLNVGYAFGGALAILGFLFANLEVPDRIEARIRSFFRLRLGCYKCCPPPEVVDDESSVDDKPLADDGSPKQKGDGPTKEATVDVTTPLTATH